MGAALRAQGAPGSLRPGMSRRSQLVLAAALGLAPTHARAELPAGRWQLLAQEFPPTLAPGVEVEVPVTLRNGSGEVWSEAHMDRLAYHWFASDGRMIERDGLRTPLPAPLAPGESVTLRARVRAPVEPGRYYLQFEPVREHRRWWGPPGLSRDIVIAVDVQAIDADLAWSIEPTDPLPSLAAGQQVEVPLRLRNAGGAAWSPLSGDHLSYHWIDLEGRRSEGLRTDLPGPVAPGQALALRARLRAPASPGAHTLVWEPVREHVRWFGPPLAGLADTTVVVGPARDRFLLDVDTPPLHADTTTETLAIVTNLGDDWPADHGLALGYHWLHPDGSTREFDGLRTPLPALASGEETVVVAALRGPAEPGPHLLSWELVREHVGWYPPERPVRAVVDVAPPLLAWSLVAAEWPWTVPVGREQRLRVRLRNTGLADLSPETGDRLGYRWRAVDGGRLGEEGLRSELPGVLSPGAAVSVDLRVSGPSQPGARILELGLVREHVAWVSPSPGAVSVAQPVRVIRRSDLIQLALLLATLALIVAARRGRLGAAALRRAPALWLWAASLALGLSFTDLAAIAPWPGAVAISASAAALPAILLLLAPARVRPLLAALIALALAALLLADLMYMQLLGSIVPLQALTGAHQVGDIGASIAALTSPGHLWLAAPGLAGLLLALLWPPVPKTSSSRATPLALALLAEGAGEAVVAGLALRDRLDLAVAGGRVAGARPARTREAAAVARRADALALHALAREHAQVGGVAGLTLGVRRRCAAGPRVAVPAQARARRRTLPGALAIQGAAHAVAAHPVGAVVRLRAVLPRPAGRTGAAAVEVALALVPRAVEAGHGRVHGLRAGGRRIGARGRVRGGGLIVELVDDRRAVDLAQGPGDQQRAQAGHGDASTCCSRARAACERWTPAGKSLRYCCQQAGRSSGSPRRHRPARASSA